MKMSTPFWSMKKPSYAAIGLASYYIGILGYGSTLPPSIEVQEQRIGTCAEAIEDDKDILNDCKLFVRELVDENGILIFSINMDRDELEITAPSVENFQSVANESLKGGEDPDPLLLGLFIGTAALAVVPIVKIIDDYADGTILLPTEHAR
ncbi:MAG: hypothetical protein ACI9T8_000093 [Candidatus Saccharimonadales bacterium]|jgi:hypothetical protein